MCLLRMVGLLSRVSSMLFDVLLLLMSEYLSSCLMLMLWGMVFYFFLLKVMLGVWFLVWIVICCFSLSCFVVILCRILMVRGSLKMFCSGKSLLVLRRMWWFVLMWIIVILIWLLECLVICLRLFCSVCRIEVFCVGDVLGVVWQLKIVSVRVVVMDLRRGWGMVCQVCCC